MKLFPLLACASLCFCSAVPQDTPKPAVVGAAKIDPAELQKLAWLSGTWVVEQGEVVTEEHWRPLAGNTLLGTSHTYDKTRTRFFEFLRVTAMNGKIAYIALPANAQEPTVFLLQRASDQEVVFENPQHDYPQRIRYAKTPAGLTATISLLDGARAQSFEFKRK
jgi:hypothetical protein